MEEAQVGGGSGNAMGPSAADLADNSGPLEDRIVSKNWSVRAGAYDELLAICQKDQPNSKADHYQNHCGQFKTYLKDANPGALEKALDLMIVFLDKCHKSIVEQNQNDVIPVLVEKCIGHAKPNIKSKSKECFLLIFEISENFDDSIETINALISHKNIKVLTSANIALAALVEHYSHKKVKIAQYGTQMLKNAQSTNPQCKLASYLYYQAVYKWIGDALLPQIEEKLKKTQMDDLKKAFEEIKSKNDKNKRLTRSEQAAENKKQEAAKEEAGDAEMEQILQQEETKEEVVDALEFAPEVDVLSKFQNEWIDTTSAIKAWQDKKAKIDEIVEVCKNIKIKPGSVDPIANYLKKEISGVNINIGMAAMDAGTALALGLREHFQQGAKTLIGVYLLKFKEKRPMVLEKLKAFLEAVVNCATFEDMAEEIIPCIGNAAPGVQNGTVKFVETLTLVTYQDVLERVAPELMPAIVKMIDAKDGGVRDSTLHCLGILKGRLKDKFSKYLKEGAANKQKTEKIDEAAKEVQPSKFDKPKGWKPKPKPAAKPKPDPKEDVVMENEDKGPGDDSLMNFDMGPPKRKPPPNIGKKPPSRKKPAEDAEMKNEEEEKQTAASTSAKPKPKPKPSAPIIVDESGEGMTKEEAIEKVSGHFQNTQGFDSAKWQDKQEAFKSLQQQIEEQKPDPEMLEACSKFVKAKMKDFKESNINLMKEIIATYTCIATHCDAINKRTFHVAMQFMVEKIGDVKMSTLIKEFVVLAAEKVSPKYISNQIIKYGSTTKAPKNIQESCVVLQTICDDFGVKGIPLKETIDFGKLAAAHATPAVRQAANKLFCELFRHAGEGIRTFMEDIKESTLKIIDAELSKITQYAKGEHEVKRFWVGDKQISSGPGPDNKKKKKSGEPDSDDLFGDLPREDISKKLTSKLIEKFSNKDWKIRKEGAEDVMAILKEAKMRIEDSGLNPLLEALKNGMKDANKACLKLYITILGQLAQAVGSSIRQYTKKCFVPMIKHLAYKDGAVRAEVVNTMDKWADTIGPEKIIDKVSQELIVENPESRKETLKWIEKNKESIADADAQSMIKPFVTCLSDKSKDIRDQTESLCCEIMPLTGFNDFMAATKDFKPAVQQTLKPILERIKTNSGGGAKKVQVTNKSSEKQKEVKEEVKNEEPVMNSFAKKALANKENALKTTVKKQNTKKDALNSSRGGNLNSSRGGKPSIEPVEDEGMMIKANAKKKDQRALNDGRTKYPINEVKGDHVEKLQAQCMEAFGIQFHDQMFAKSQDFQKHIGCVDQISKFIESEYDQLLLIVDVVFKWTNLRMTESSNTQLAVNIFDFYKKLLTKMIDQGQQLQEFEMIVLLATLCDKSGLNNKNLQESVRKLIRMCYQVYDIKGCYRIIIDYGVKNKNLKSAAECLDEIADYIVANGVDVIQKKDYKLFIEMADNKDKSVRENSLKVFGEAYIVLGEKIWTFLKDVPPKVKGLLEQRFKTVAKKTGGLGSSINSAKGGNMQNTLKFKAGGDKNRNSLAPGLSGSLGGFNKTVNSLNKVKPSPQKPEKEDQEITNKLADMDPFGQQMKLEPEDNDGDIEMKDETNQHKQNMQDIFKQPQKDEEMAMDDPQSAPPDEQASPVKGSKAQLDSNNEKQQRKMNEDDDLIQQKIKDAEQSLQQHADPALREQIEFILSHIKQLREGDLLKRVDSLVLLNEVISATGPQNQVEPPQNLSAELVNQQKALIICCNDLINAFTHVMDDIFKHPVNDIPLRFTKYFITIVNKTCTSKELMTEVSEKSVHDLVEQLLTRLLIDNLDKIGQNKEGELILKNLNSSMIRMLENCNHTYVFGVLFGLLKKFQNDNSLPKMHGLIIKCLLKLNKIMHKLIEKLDLQKFLISIHEYLVIIDHNNRTQNDDLGIRIVKTLINEIVKLKGESIWQPYEVIRQHQSQDNHIEKWILIILKSLQLNQNQNQNQGNDSNNASGGGAVNQRSATMLEFEFKKILMELRDPTKYENAIRRLAKFAQNYPQYNYEEKLDKEQPVFKDKVLNSLEQYKNSSSWKSTNANTDSLGGVKQEGRFNTFKDKIENAKGPDIGLNRSLNQQKFDSKMAKFKRTSVAGPSIGGLEANRNSAAANNLNTSFSAMNQKFVDKWDNMKKRNVGGNTQRPSTASNNLSQTMGPGGFGNQNALNTSQNKFQSKFASRVQQSQTGAGVPGFQTQNSVAVPSSGSFAGNQTQQVQQEANGAPRSQRIGGGIQSNSFRSRLDLQGMGNANQANAQGASAQGQSGAATHQDLKQRLDQMKMKMQALKKQ